MTSGGGALPMRTGSRGLVSTARTPPAPRVSRTGTGPTPSPSTISVAPSPAPAHLRRLGERADRLEHERRADRRMAGERQLPFPA